MIASIKEKIGNAVVILAFILGGLLIAATTVVGIGAWKQSDTNHTLGAADQKQQAALQAAGQAQLAFAVYIAEVSLFNCNEVTKLDPSHPTCPPLPKIKGVTTITPTNTVPLPPSTK